MIVAVLQVSVELSVFISWKQSSVSWWVGNLLSETWRLIAEIIMRWWCSTQPVTVFSISSVRLRTTVPQVSCSTAMTTDPIEHTCSLEWLNRLIHTHTHTRLTALFPGLPRWAGTRKVNQSGFYWSKRQRVAVASAGPYASLHLAPDR